MKRYLIIFFAVLILGPFFSNLWAKAGILKNPFSKFTTKQKQPKNTEQNITSDTTLKAKAVYLELEGDSVEYDHEQNIYTTSGMCIAKIVDQDAFLEADEIIYYGDDQHIEAIGNIKITREDVVTVGESFRFNVTSNKYLLTRPDTRLQGAVIKSRNVTSDGKNEIEYDRGRLRLDKPIRIAQGFGAKKHPPTFYSHEASRMARKKPTWADLAPRQKYRVTAEKIIYEHDKKLNNLTLYAPRIYFRNFSIPLGQKITTTVSSDPDVRTAPLIAPTIGTQGALGGFALGPAFNLNVTDHHILSLSPFGQIGDGSEFGIGGRVGFSGPTTTARLAYGSLRDRFVGQLRQKILRNTEFRAAYNEFLDNGFLGRTLAQVNVELVDKRKFDLPFTESGVNFRSSGNWAQSNTKILPSDFAKLQREAGEPGEFKNSAFKVEEQIALVSKPIFKIGNDNYNTAFRVRTRNALRAYSTGDLQGIFTAGPLLDNTFGPVSFELGYDQGIVKGNSPLFYDQYIQGKKSVSLDGDVKLHEWVTVGGYGTYNINAEEIVERQFRAKVGPKDFKMLVNFDALRQQTQFGLNFLFGEPVDFERFVIINSLNRNVGGI